MSYSLLDKLSFLRYLSYGQGLEEAWLSAFGTRYRKEDCDALLRDSDFQELKRRYSDEIKSTGASREEIMLELDSLNEEARKVTDELDLSRKLEGIRVRQKGVELKARISRKLGDNQEVNVNLSLPVMDDKGLLKAMDERRKQIESDKKIGADIIEADFEEVAASEDKDGGK